MFVRFSDATLNAILDTSNDSSKRIVIKCIRLKRDEDAKATKAAMILTPAIIASSNTPIVEALSDSLTDMYVTTLRRICNPLFGHEHIAKMMRKVY